MDPIQPGSGKTGSPAPPLAVMVPLPEIFCAVTQTLPPEPPPDRLFVAFRPFAEIIPFIAKLLLAMSRIVPPPLPPIPP